MRKRKRQSGGSTEIVVGLKPEHPEVFAGKGITETADYEEAIIRRLDRKPVIVGHSFGGLLTMILAGRGHALTIDAGWRDVAQKALEFVKRFA